MTTHVFIVDATTFPLHLEYLFAGTGAGESSVDFNGVGTTALHWRTENNLVSMIADGCRIRKGDGILFYLQQNAQQSITEGKFFGTFKTAQDGIFLDNNDNQQYLKNELRKSLTFRTLIEPATVYAAGVTEWEALDKITNIASPYQMPWSLIYRKLKGNRGNTMITSYEAERLMKLISDKNNGVAIQAIGSSLSFDRASQRIVVDSDNRRRYQGRKEDIQILPRLIAKSDARQAFEVHLQAYIMQNLGKGINPALDTNLIGAGKIEWLGNEVSCGVGMQSIDVVASIINRDQHTLLPVELKAVEAKAENVTQIQRYVDWISQYYIPNRPSHIIQPVLIAKRPDKKTARAQRTFQAFVDAKRGFDFTNKGIANPLKYVEFFLNDSALQFAEVNLDRRG